MAMDGLRNICKGWTRMIRTGLALLICWAPAIHAAADGRWVDAWSAPPDSAGPAFSSQTIRQVVRITIGGSGVRIRLSNLFGTEPVLVGPVHIAAHGSGASILQGTDHRVTFSGKPQVTIPMGVEVLSDPVPFRVTALEELSVSIYLPRHTGKSTVHALAMQTAYLTQSGDATAAQDFPVGEVASSRYFLTDVEVLAGQRSRVIVTMGDSITDGYASTVNRNARWPDFLAARLQSDATLASIAVVDAGISGNRILNDGDGPSALSRFDRDVLGKAEVGWIVLLEGINDIGVAGNPPTSRDNVSAEQIIDGMKTLIARAHRNGIRVIGTTITPFGGWDWPYHSAAGEAKRRAVNTWIRSGGAFDGLVDFEQAIRDPASPDRLLPANDSGDHLHPNDAGYKAMADAIDLGLFADAIERKRDANNEH